jgi:hypothetical protein
MVISVEAITLQCDPRFSTLTVLTSLGMERKSFTENLLQFVCSRGHDSEQRLMFPQQQQQWPDAAVL